MKKILLFFFFGCHFLSVAAQNSFSYRVDHYTTEDGLIHNSGNCFVQDEYGFIWIGTNGGLERFDGYEFVNYLSNAGDSGALTSSRINALFKDKNNTLWVGTSGGGLNRYLYDEDRFVAYRASSEENSISNDNISFIGPAGNTKLWIGTHGGGLNLFDPEEQTCRVFSADSPENSLNSNDLSCFVFDNNGDLWIGGLDGINIIDTATNAVRNYNTTEGDLAIFRNQVIRAISKDAEGNIWIGAWVNGVYKLDIATNIVSRVSEIAGRPEIHSIIPVSPSEMAIATNKGLYLTHITSYKSTRLQHDPLNPYSLSHNTCISLFKDAAGVLWIGTVNSGIDKVDLYQKKFELHKRNVLSKNTLSHNFVNDFEEDWQGLIWIGTHKGLNRFNPENGKFRNFHFLDKYIDDKINAVEKGEYPFLWVGTDYGLVKFNTVTGRHIRYEMNAKASGPSNNVINDLCYDSVSGNLWIGSWGGGLDKFSTRDNEWKNFPVDDIFADNVVLTIKKDVRGNLWLGTFSKGLMRFVPDKEVLEPFNADNEKLEESAIISLLVNSEGKIWTGTGANGIFVIDPLSNDVLNINVQIGLNSNEIAGIEENRPDEYWISSSKGLSKMRVAIEEAENGKMTLDHLILYHYDQADGLQSNAFNQKASIKTTTGKLCFGGSKGFNCFYPDSIRINPFLPTPILTSFELMGHRIVPKKPTNDRVILEKPIFKTNEITLKHDENMILFELSAMHFAAPEKNKFSYKLENFHDQWITADASRRFVTFSYLKPGRYNLKVRATNNDGIWNSSFTLLRIHVLPPWWGTFWFKIFTSIAFIFLVFSFVKYRTYKLKMRQKLLEKIITDRTHEIIEQKNDIQAQNEELIAMNETISRQTQQLTKTNEALKKAQKELKRINQNLDKTVRERTAELEKTVNELDHFVYVASHDLGAPLKSVLGLINITRLDHKDNDLHQKLNMIESSIVKLEKVIFSLKQFSRNSKQQMAVSDIKLNDVIVEIADSMRFVDNFQRIGFHISIPENLVIRNDLTRLKSVFTNLIDNAIKYHDYEKPRPFISIKASIKWRACYVSISDNGRGIEDHLIDNIFNMFYRASTHSEGSGLGLYIVKESLGKLNGTIKVKSKLHAGTTFIIRLPLSYSDSFLRS